jgi:hypothetical protein
MKKLIIVILLGTSVFISSNHVEAAEYKKLEEVTDPSSENILFKGLQDSDKVVELDDGTFLHGEATIGVVGANEDEMITVNSETAPNAVTIDVAKEILLEDEGKNYFKPMPRGFVSSFNYKGLRYGSFVTGTFSRSVGWNSLNTVYQSTERGAYLRYYSGEDSAMVGTAQQATRTFSGSLSGNLLPINSYKYFAGINTMYTYYGRSNMPWQGYQIANID